MVFSKSFLSHRTEKISPGNHSVFHKNFGGEENFMDGRGWGYHDFPSEMLCLTLPKLLHWRKIFCFKKIFNSKIFMHTRGGITILSKNFVLQDRNEKFCKGTLLFSRKTLVTKNFNCDRGITFFRRKFLVSQCRKILWASLQCFRNFVVSSNFMHQRRRGYHDSPLKTFVTHYRKMSLRNSSVFQKNSCIAKFYA